MGPMRFFKLSNGTGSLGLSCGKDGVALAGVPLLLRGELGFQPRPEEQLRELMANAYGSGADSAKLITGLDAVARALNADNIAHAMTVAVLMKLPELDWGGAARIAKADDALARYSEDQPRDWHGRWTVGSGGETSSPVAEVQISQAVQVALPIDENIGEITSLPDGRSVSQSAVEIAGEENGSGSTDSRRGSDQF